MGYTQKAFTLVELAVVITVIAILTAGAAFGFTQYQKNTRDAERDARVKIVTEALEKYYEKNGEYPSPSALVSSSTNTGAAVANRLGVNAGALVLPGAAAGVTNSFAASLTSSSVIAYVAKSAVNNAQCQTSTTGGCDEFTITYRKEIGNKVITVKSRQSGRGAGFETTPNAPAQPTISATQSGTAIIATSSSAGCESGVSNKYSFQVQVGTGVWSAWTNWQTSTSYSRSGNTDSVVYSFRVKTRCDNGSTVGKESVISNIASVTYKQPLSAPAIPALTVALSGTSAVATAAVATCTVGTPEYRIDSRTNVGAWTTGDWSTARTSSATGVQQGTRYGFRLTVRCVRGTDAPATSGIGAEATYTHPISAPTAPTISVAGSATNIVYTRSNSACPTDTTARYQYKYVGDWNYDSGWYGTSASSLTWTAASQGYEFKIEIQAQCYNSYATSGWSASRTAAYIRPVTAPAAATGFSFYISSNRMQYGFNWTAPACHSSVRAEYQYNSYAEGMTWNGNGSPWSAGSSTGWSAQGFWTASLRHNPVNTDTGQPMALPAAKAVQAKVRYICVNSTTGRTSAWGPAATSPQYNK